MISTVLYLLSIRLTYTELKIYFMQKYVVKTSFLNSSNERNCRISIPKNTKYISKGNTIVIE